MSKDNLTRQTEGASTCSSQTKACWLTTTHTHSSGLRYRGFYPRSVKSNFGTWQGLATTWHSCYRGVCTTRKAYAQQSPQYRKKRDYRLQKQVGKLGQPIYKG